MNLFVVLKMFPGSDDLLLRIPEFCLKCSWLPSVKGLHCFCFALYLQKCFFHLPYDMKMLAMVKSKVRRRMMLSGTLENLDIIGQIAWTLVI